MKTKIITELKKEILVIEFPEGYELAGVTNGVIYYYDNQMNYEDYPLSVLVEGSYTLLGSFDDLKEEDVRSLVSDFDAFENSKYYYLHGFWKLIEKEIYWENPKPKLSDFEYFLPSINEAVKLQKKFDEAQEKTFDRNRTLIFVKN